MLITAPYQNNIITPGRPSIIPVTRGSLLLCHGPSLIFSKIVMLREKRVESGATLFRIQCSGKERRRGGGERDDFYFHRVVVPFFSSLAENEKNPRDRKFPRHSLARFTLVDGTDYIDVGRTTHRLSELAA